jgi:hypothetical protein
MLKLIVEIRRLPLAIANHPGRVDIRAISRAVIEAVYARAHARRADFIFNLRKLPRPAA